MADFYLRDGKLVFGKLVSEDKNKITIERLDGSRIVVSTYSKREVDTRTLQTKSVPESKYYLDLAEYFSGRTWDFRDDPDDFIQAIRCYEKAKRFLAETQGPDSEKIDEINKKIEQLQAERQVWIREVESRAKLKKLEFEAMIETRINELEDKVNASSQRVDKSVARFDKMIAEMKDNYQKMASSISEINKAMSRQWEALEYRIETNRRLFDRWGRWYPIQPYPYRWYYRREKER
jgi:type I site-specific restriction endonuclease